MKEVTEDEYKFDPLRVRPRFRRLDEVQAAHELDLAWRGDAA